LVKYLLDSDWAIYYLRGKEPFVKAIDKYRQEGIAISVVSVAELYEGVFWNPKPEEKESVLLDFLEGFATINLSKPISRLFGKKRAELRGKGLTVNNFDLLIACTAEYHKLAILTNNMKHFEKVPGIGEIISLNV
jgi:tRNA(fMet)-specific endonuclease VapC